MKQLLVISGLSVLVDELVLIFIDFNIFDRLVSPPNIYNILLKRPTENKYLTIEVGMFKLDQRQMEISLQGLTNGHNAKETVMFLKGYVLGFLGIPFGNQCWLDIMDRMEEYISWFENDLISLKGYVNTVNAAILAVRSHHNKPTNETAYAKTAKVFLGKLAELIIMIRNTPEVFQNQPCETYANSTYSHLGDDLSLDEGYAECSICEQQLKPDASYQLQCGHTFHQNCLCEYFLVKIQDRQEKIQCPEQNCNLGIQGQILCSILPPVLQKKYLDLILSKYIEKNGQTTSWCPTPDCPVVFQYDSSVNQFQCFSCKKKYCLNCKCPSHNNMTCSEYRQLMNLDEQQRSFICFVRGAKFKQCPKCQYWVQRTFGCPTMKCHCSQVFCYNCGGTTCPHGKCTSNIS